MIAGHWKLLSTEGTEFYRDVAARDLGRYSKEVETAKQNNGITSATRDHEQTEVKQGLVKSQRLRSEACVSYYPSIKFSYQHHMQTSQMLTITLIHHLLQCCFETEIRFYKILQKGNAV